MAAPFTCPPTNIFRQLMADELPPAEQTGLVAHLDQCPGCRERLEVLAAGDSGWAEVARAVGQASHFHEKALIRLLADLKTDPDVTQLHRPQPITHWMKALLQPAASPDLLGKLESYDVAEVIGQGGMGIVLKAFDPALCRLVAIKVLAPNLAGDPVFRTRFAREGQAIAAVRHENVVTIHAVSEANGLPFFVMEYVDGGSLEELLRRDGPLDWRTTVHLGMQVASGLAAAHAQGLIHRDIKPANILLMRNAEYGMRNDEGDASAVRSLIRAPHSAFRIAKITDFGLARLMDDARLTQSGVVAGTPMYMSPEQAMAEPIDARTDLFSLGSVLYFLCTGQEPFAAVTPMAVMQRVCQEEPRPIRELNAAVPEWLIEVIRRLHAKRPEHRFHDAAEVAELFRSYLAHRERPEEVPEPRLSAIRLPARKPRRRRIAAAASLALASGLALSEAMGWSHIGRAVLPDARHEEIAAAVPRATLHGNLGPVLSAAFSPDGQSVVTGGDDGTIRLWDLQGNERANLTGHGNAVYALRFAGNELISGDDDGQVKLWNVASRRVEKQFRNEGGTVRTIAVSPDSRTVAVAGSDRQVELWDIASLKRWMTLQGHRSTISTVAFSPDGKTLASGDSGGHVRIWNLTDGSEHASFQADPLRVRSLAFLPDGDALVTSGSGDRQAKLWQAHTGELRFAFPTHRRGIGPLAVAPDGRRLACGTIDGSIQFRDTATHRSLGTVQAHLGNIRALAFSPDGQTLISVGEDRLGKLWDVSAVRPPS